MRRGFTLVELLVVIGIIATLSALLLPLLHRAQRIARETDTAQRLEAPLQGLKSLGGDGRTPAYILHRGPVRAGLLALGKPTGALDLAVSQVKRSRVPVLFNAAGQPGPPVGNDGAWLVEATMPAFCTVVPWGKPWSYPTGAGTPRGMSLADLSPLATVELLRAAGIEVDLARWQTDRARSRPWNDAWGRPLVVAYGFYQPSRDLFDLAERSYQYTRAVYVAAGAVGHRLRTPLTGSLAADAPALWSQVADVCDAAAWRTEFGVAGGVVTTTANAFATPPDSWLHVKGLRKADGPGGERCFLTAPIELQ